jgi:hypothetical protein
MTAAWIGLTGVIAGAVLAGFVNLWLERQKERSLAIAAGSVVSNELGVAKRRIESGLATKTWWTSPLPTEAWDSYAKEIAIRIRPNLLQRLSTAYADIKLWESESVQRRQITRQPAEETSPYKKSKSNSRKRPTGSGPPRHG